MAKFYIQGLMVHYYEGKEIEADDEEEATYLYYLMFKDKKLEVVNEEWEIDKTEKR